MGRMSERGSRKKDGGKEEWRGRGRGGWGGGVAREEALDKLCLGPTLASFLISSSRAEEKLCSLYIIACHCRLLKTKLCALESETNGHAGHCQICRNSKSFSFKSFHVTCYMINCSL
jgi:hypothetical protein